MLLLDQGILIGLLSATIMGILIGWLFWGISTPKEVEGI